MDIETRSWALSARAMSSAPIDTIDQAERILEDLNRGWPECRWWIPKGCGFVTFGERILPGKIKGRWGVFEIDMPLDFESRDYIGRVFTDPSKGALTYSHVGSMRDFASVSRGMRRHFSWYMTGLLERLSGMEDKS